jgi:excisionase family DNA binding protein
MKGMLNLNEVMRFLVIDQRTVEKLVKRGRLHAYKVGGLYLRFEKDEVLTVKRNYSLRFGVPSLFWDTILEWWRFNNFYILSFIVLVLLILLLFR